MKNKLNNLNELAYFRASESYCIAVNSNGKEDVKSRPMKFFAKILLEAGWCRIHRSYIVNPQYINNISIDHESVRLVNGKELPISRRLRGKVLK
jgi:DNA-binding LytR/AlgR family response regulator